MFNQIKPVLHQAFRHVQYSTNMAALVSVSELRMEKHFCATDSSHWTDPKVPVQDLRTTVTGTEKVIVKKYRCRNTED